MARLPSGVVHSPAGRRRHRHRPAALVGVHTVDDALRICRDFYPDDEVSSRARGVPEELFG